MTRPDATQPAETADAVGRRRLARFDLSATQLIATALAAITATIAASYLGVSGTVIGAALASVVSAVGNAVYGHSLRSTRERVRVDRVLVRERRPHVAAAPSGGATAMVDAPPVLPSPHASRADRPRPRPTKTSRSDTAWRRIAIGSVASFVAVLAVVTGVEVVAGRPLSDLVRGDGGTGTSVFGTRGDQSTTPAETPTVTRTVTPSVVVTTPTVTQTAPAVTKTATPTPTTAPSAPASGSGAAGATATSTAGP
jgi:hypothetical protein